MRNTFMNNNNLCYEQPTLTALTGTQCTVIIVIQIEYHIVMTVLQDTEILNHISHCLCTL